MALTRTGTALSSLKSTIVAAAFTNVDVAEIRVLPSGSKALQKMAKDIIRGNATIIVMPRKERFAPLSNTTKGRVNRYDSPLSFSIGLYSKFFGTDEVEDLVKIYDNLIDLLHSKGYRILDGSYSDANYADKNSDLYYEARVEIELTQQYPTN